MTAGKPDIKYIVSLTIKNGPFKTKQSAISASHGIKSKNKAASTGSFTKGKNGHFFKTTIRYGARTVAAKNAIVKKLGELRRSSAIPNSAIVINTRTL